MNYVFVVDVNRVPCMPCHPARARELLTKRKAAVLRRYPFTIILKHTVTPDPHPLSVNIDPGSKTTGMAITVQGKRGRRCIYAMHLVHRGSWIRKCLQSRAAVRRNRRTRNLRSRPKRFNNRTNNRGKLMPSVMHRVHTVSTWVRRFYRRTPGIVVNYEMVKFDVSSMSGESWRNKHSLEYANVREYLLNLHNYTCQYCVGTTGDKILEIDHKVPRSRGGSDRVSNLTVACRTCNLAKSNHMLMNWRVMCNGPGKVMVARRKQILLVEAGVTPSLRDAAVMNAVAGFTVRAIQSLWIGVVDWPSYMTRYNRTRQGHPKDHWIDAAVLGSSTSTIHIPPKMRPQIVTCMGHGSRQMVVMDKYGFPRTKPKKTTRYRGIITGDYIRTIGGKYPNHTTRVVMTKGKVRLLVNGKLTDTHIRNCKRIHRDDGYKYE